MINKVILVGNVGVDPEIRTLESGVKMAKIALATTERHYNRETKESKEHTEWHTLIAWRGTAEVADKYIRKGSQLYVEGSLRTRNWLDKENVKHYTTEILVNELKLLGKRADSGVAQGNSSATSNSAPTAPAISPIEEDIDNLPF